MATELKKSEAYLYQERDMMYREINRCLSSFLNDNDYNKLFLRHNKTEDTSVVYLAREIRLRNKNNEIISEAIRPEDLFSLVKLEPEIEQIIKPYIRNKKIVEGVLNLSKTYSDEDLKNYILESDFNSYKDLFGGESYTPLSVVKLANKILDIQKGDVVLDTTCGECNFLLHSYQKENNITLNGFEINDDCIKLAKLRASIIGCNINFEQGDIFKTFPEEKADKIFSNHPFRMTVRKNEFVSNECSKLTDGKIKSIKPYDDEWYITALMLNRLKENGKAVAIVRGETLFSSIETIREKSLKKYIIENGYVETVIALPPRMLVHTAIDTFMVVFSKGNEKINFIDATEISGESSRNAITILSDEDIIDIVNMVGKSTKRSSINLISEVIEKDYDLTPFVYATKLFESLRFVKLEEVCKEVVRGDQVKSAFFDDFIVKNENDNNTGISFLEQGDIQQGYVYQGYRDDVAYLKELPEKKERFLTTDCCIVLPRVITGDATKLASIDSNDKQYYIRGHLVVLNLDRDKINPNYLAALLTSEEGQKILKTASTGNAIHTLSVSRLSHMDIPLLSMKEQDRIGDSFKEMTEKLKSLTVESKKIENSMMHLYDTRLSNRGEASDYNTVTNVIQDTKQPRGGYLPLKLFTEIDLEEIDELLPDENVSGSEISFCVKDLFDFMISRNATSAFKTAFKGARRLDELEETSKYTQDFLEKANKIKGLDDESIQTALELIRYEVVYRVNAETYYKYRDSLEEPNSNSIHNIRVMVQRCLNFFEKNGAVLDMNFGFDGAYTTFINKAEAGYLTEDGIYDIKVNKSIDSKQTLQILTYYLMAKKTGKRCYKNVTKMGLINPKLCKAYVISALDIDEERLNLVKQEVIGYK